jgi:prephenate dehydrogenase
VKATSFAIVGTGLIGASIGLGLRSKKPTLKIAGWDTSEAARAAALRRGAITRVAGSLQDALAGAGVVVIAAPLEATIELVPRAIAQADPGALVLDVAGLMGPVVASAARTLRRRPDVGFVSGHPMAGMEKVGARYARPDIFVGRPFALTAPPQRHRERYLRKAEALVRSLRAKPIRLTSPAHDRLVAATSALPQLGAIAVALAAHAASKGRARLLSGPGWADTTRLAASPYHIWRAVLRLNRPAVGAALRQLEQALARLVRAVRHSDDRAMKRLFSLAGKARRRGVGV